MEREKSLSLVILIATCSESNFADLILKTFQTSSFFSNLRKKQMHLENENLLAKQNMCVVHSATDIIQFWGGLFQTGHHCPSLEMNYLWNSLSCSNFVVFYSTKMEIDFTSINST